MLLIAVAILVGFLLCTACLFKKFGICKKTAVMEIADVENNGELPCISECDEPDNDLNVQVFQDIHKVLENISTLWNI